MLFDTSNKHPTSSMNRKTFLINSVILFSGQLLGCKTSTKDAEVTSLISFDLHTHPGVFIKKGMADYPGDMVFAKRMEDMRLNKISGAFFSLVADMPLLKITETGIVPRGKFKEGEGWAEFEQQLAILKDLLLQNNIKITFSGDELKADKTIQAYLSCEGGDFLDGNIDNVKKCYDEGVRSIQLVHYAPNLLGDLQTWKAEFGGLSPFGKEVVKEMNRLGMVIDVAHASVRTVKNVADLTQAPIILSHSILKGTNNGPISARAISKDHAKLVADTGGVIGMWPSGFSASFDAFVEHTFSMIDAVGIDHVGIGTDMDGNYKPVISDYTEFTNWQNALLDKGLSKTELGKISGGNAKRVLEAVL